MAFGVDCVGDFPEVAEDFGRYFALAYCPGFYGGGVLERVGDHAAGGGGVLLRTELVVDGGGLGGDAAGFLTRGESLLDPVFAVVYDVFDVDDGSDLRVAELLATLKAVDG